MYRKNASDDYYNYLLKCYLVLEDFNEAQKVTEKHIRKNRNRSALFRVDLVYVQVKANEKTKAEENLNRIFDEVAQNPGLAHGVSKKFSSYGFLEEALYTFEVAEKASPAMAFHYQKALVYAEMGDLENMFREYLNLIEQNPSYFNTVKQMIQFTIKQDQTDGANIMLKEMLIERVQENSNVLYNDLLVWLLIQEKNYGQAFIQLKALDKRLNRNQSEIFNLGRICTINKAYSTAHKCFDYILKIGETSPFYEDALLQTIITKSLELEENTATAEEYTQLISDIDDVLTKINFPKEVLHLKRIKAHTLAYKLKQPETAIALLEEAVKKQRTEDPGIGECKVELGHILLSFGDSYEALLYFAQVDKAFPESELGQKARFNKAMIAFYQGDFDWAKAQFDILKTSTTKFIANDAMNMSLVISDNTFQDEDSTFTALKWYAKAKLLSVREDYDSAMIVLDSITVTYPYHTLQDDILFEKGLIYLKQGNANAAIQEFEKVVNEFGTDILADEALYKLGALFEEKGDTQQAMAYYEQLFSEHGDSIFASLARDAYRRLRGDKLFN